MYRAGFVNRKRGLRRRMGPPQLNPRYRYTVGIRKHAADGDGWWEPADRAGAVTIRRRISMSTAGNRTVLPCLTSANVFSGQTRSSNGPARYAGHPRYYYNCHYTRVVAVPVVRSHPLGTAQSQPAGHSTPRAHFE